jgi:hypothetical protein
MVNKTRRKLSLLKDAIKEFPSLDFTVQLDKLKTTALMFGDYETAVMIRKFEKELK